MGKKTSSELSPALSRYLQSEELAVKLLSGAEGDSTAGGNKDEAASGGSRKEEHKKDDCGGAWEAVGEPVKTGDKEHADEGWQDVDKRDGEEIRTESPVGKAKKKES